MFSCHFQGWPAAATAVSPVPVPPASPDWYRFLLPGVYFNSHRTPGCPQWGLIHHANSSGFDLGLHPAWHCLLSLCLYPSLRSLHYMSIPPKRGGWCDRKALRPTSVDDQLGCEITLNPLICSPGQWSSLPALTQAFFFIPSWEKCDY